MLVRIRLVALGLAALVSIAAASPADAGERTRRHQPEGSDPVLTKPDPMPSKTASPTIVVNEGSLERPLWIDTTRVAEFPVVGGTDQPALRPAEPGELTDGTRTSKLGDEKNSAARSGAAKTTTGAAVTAAAPAAVSPVFVDASGRPRALPGGVIVTLKGTMPPDAARAELQAAGLTPLRRIGERMWLVESDPGLATLDLANRLHRDGRFEFVQPNWWNARTTK